MILVGTCSWTEKTLIKSGAFYPKAARTADARIRYYAEHFNTVEVDSSYYAIPDKSTTSLWVSRTPDRFIFHIKVYGALTGHGIDPLTLPPDIRSELPKTDMEKRRIYIKEPSLLSTISQRLRESIHPLVHGNKLGVLVFQFPPWFQYKPDNLDYILKCREFMSGLKMAVEFRHGSWLSEKHRDIVLTFLRDNQITSVVADEPQFGDMSTVPFVPALTTDIAYFRFHGRNRTNWSRKGIETSLRFAYKYTDEELKEFIPAVTGIDQAAKRSYLMFNNCYGSFAVENATRMREMLK